jgi:hypothetical protein
MLRLCVLPPPAGKEYTEIAVMYAASIREVPARALAAVWWHCANDHGSTADLTGWMGFLTHSLHLQVS